VTEGAKLYSNKHEVILFLTLETFSKTGGIQNASRYLAKALTELKLDIHKKVRVLSLCDRTHDMDNRYVSIDSFKGFGYNKFTFCIAAFIHGRLADTIILSHVNLLPVASCIKSICPGTRIILVAHGKEVWSGLSRWKKRFLQQRVEIWAVSTFTQQTLIEKHQIQNEKIQVLNNCLDPYFDVPQNFQKPRYLLNRFNLCQDDLVMFSISRLNIYEKDKGYDLVLDLMPDLVKLYPTLKYIIAGRADEKENARISKRIKESHLSKNIQLIGYVPDAHLSDHHLLSDLFIMPSHKEGFGLVFIEALACGSRVIAGNIDGSVDALLNGRLGTLVNPTSKTAIFNAIITLLKQPRNQNEAYERQELTVRIFHFDTYKKRVAHLLMNNQS
jgi:phosphatidylinositol alpha-1,6-mannosyltransferase